MTYKPILRSMMIAALIGCGAQSFANPATQPPKRSAPLIQINVNTPPVPDPLHLTAQMIERISRQMQHRLILDEAQFLKLLRLNERFLLNLQVAGPRPPYGAMRPGGKPPVGPAGPRAGKPGRLAPGPKAKGPAHDKGPRAYGNPFTELPAKERKQWEKQLKNILNKDQYREWHRMEKENDGRPFRY